MRLNPLCHTRLTHTRFYLQQETMLAGGISTRLWMEVLYLNKSQSCYHGQFMSTKTTFVKTIETVFIIKSKINEI